MTTTGPPIVVCGGMTHTKTHRRSSLVLAALAAFVLALGPGPVEGHASDPAPVPPFVLAHWERLIGTWIADNTAFKDASDPNEAFGIEWEWGLGRKSLKGRLYGIAKGAEIRTYWDLHEYWHPGEGTLIATQHAANGTFGSGPQELQRDGSSEMVQTFWDPVARTTTRVGHRARLEGDTHTTISFEIDASGTWTPRRTYVWKRQRRSGA
ncbi:MAG: hypothetical protein R2712_03720 [Vicinamibacterales bacterium]